MTSSVLLFPAGAAHAADPRIDLKVLVVSDGGSSVSAIEEQLQAEGVPHRTVDLNDANRPVINKAFLEDTVSGAPRAKYQAVVLPNADPFTEAAEMTALADFEKRFGIRQVDAYVYPNAAVGMNAPGFAGALDGTTAALSATGISGPFRYLKGPVRFDDNSPTVPESYAYLASPLPDNAAQGTRFEPYLTATAQGQTGTLAGVYTHDGRSEMVLTFAYNFNQWQFRTIAHGIVSWLTKGVHLGHNRNYFAVHVDDIFLPDSRWSTQHNCTPGEDCPAGVTTPDIRMTSADVTQAVNWQNQNGFTLDMVYNGAGSDEAVAQNGSDPLTTSMVSNRARFRWVNHTYEHPYLGCKQDTSVVPWRCETDAAGNVQYVSKTEIKDQITKNLSWGRGKGLSLGADELVTGEHSGLKILPQQPDDNPGLGPALNETGVKWTASDASRGKAQRPVGNALTVPRHPMSVYFNTATKQEMADEYNWIYTSRADGGSGICEDNPATVTCIQPLDQTTGYDSHIVPVDARITLSHIVTNDPRPHYVHQSNLTEDRILYPMLDRILADYRAAFAGNATLVNPRMSALGAELERQVTWRNAMNNVTAYVKSGEVTVQRPSGVAVPITVPEGTRDCSGLLGCLLGGPAYGVQYAGERSAYTGTSVLLDLPAGAMG
ncbi:hypothetical protein HKK74_17590 [Actinomadura alba]|uniref:Secreted protein n=2 Tax=Actinomadura alba TaxID=406431 RepID=A0ABR7LR31_9ACTN|nr:hypothetical protein [Actinomadura alba]